MTNTALLGSLLTVLVVDDDEFSREALRRQLGFLKVTDIHMAYDGRNAMAVLDAMVRAPDFLICDIYMPNMDGIEIITELVKREFRGALILMSGGNQDMLQAARNIATMRGLRVLATFTKPLKHESLRQMMEFSAS